MEIRLGISCRKQTRQFCRTGRQEWLTSTEARPLVMKHATRAATPPIAFEMQRVDLWMAVVRPTVAFGWIGAALPRSWIWNTPMRCGPLRKRHVAGSADDSCPSVGNACTMTWQCREGSRWVCNDYGWDEWWVHIMALYWDCGDACAWWCASEAGRYSVGLQFVLAQCTLKRRKGKAGNSAVCLLASVRTCWWDKSSTLTCFYTHTLSQEVYTCCCETLCSVKVQWENIICRQLQYSSNNRYCNCWQVRDVLHNEM